MKVMYEYAFPHLLATFMLEQLQALTWHMARSRRWRGWSRSSMACALYLWLMPGGAMLAKAWRSRLWARCARTLSRLDFAALGETMTRSTAAQNPCHIASSSCLLRVHAPEGLVIWRLLDYHGWRAGECCRRRLSARCSRRKRLFVAIVQW